MRIETSLKYRDRLREAVNTVFRSAVKNELTSKEICDKMGMLVYEHPAYKIVPQWVNHYISGYVDCKRDEYLSQYIEYSYIVNGKCLLLSDDEYKKYPASEIDTSTGAMVYKDSKKVYFK